MRPAPSPGWPRRTLLIALSLVTLGIIVWGAVVQLSYAVLPQEVMADDIGYPLLLDGHEVRNAGELKYLVSCRNPGDELDLGRPGGPCVLEAELDDTLFVLTLLSALLFWAVFTFAFAPRLVRPAVRDIYGCFLVAALAVAIGGTSPPRGPLGEVLPVLNLLALAFMPAFLLRFSLAFPRRLGFLERHPRLPMLIFTAAAGIAAWNVFAWLTCFAADGAEAWSGTETPASLLFAFLVAGLLGSCMVLYANGRSAPLAREKRQAKWILWGIAIGVTPYVFLRTLPLLLGYGGWLLPPAVDRVVEMTIPLAFLVAVVRDQYLDIDVIIRRSLIYTVLAVAAALLFFVVVLALGDLTGVSEVYETLAYALAGALAASLFLAARRVVSRWVDRTFFKIRYTHAKALKELGHELAPAADQGQLAARLWAFLEGTLQPKTGAVAVRVGSEWGTEGSLAPTFALDAPGLLNALGPENGSVHACPDATAVPEVEDPQLPQDLVSAGVRVVQPVARGGRLWSVILLGEKRSERRYVDEDLRLLDAVASRAGRALERMELVQQVMQETVARKALAELAQQKADFFAQVAHDLRTPLTAIRWSARNLLEGLAGPLSEGQAEYLESVTAASGQLGRLVDNLVDLSRLDLDARRKPDEAVDLGAVVDEAVVALTSIAHEREVGIEVRGAHGLPAVCGRTEAVFQIVINLLDNALKYSPPDTTVAVTVGTDGDDHLRLEVRDHGPGLPPEARESLFELFGQGPASPYAGAKGFGIGLHIVKAWTETMRGTVGADNHPEGGARFACRLPRWRPLEEDS